MVKWFISHLWKEYTRSPNFGKSKGISILMGVLVFIMIIYLLALGVLMDRILTETFPDQNPVAVFNGGLIFYFFADLLIRFFMQGLPKLNIQAPITAITVNVKRFANVVGRSCSLKMC